MYRLMICTVFAIVADWSDADIFIQAPEDMNITVGDLAVLPCKVDIQQLRSPYQLQWVKDGTLLFSSDGTADDLGRFLTNWNPPSGDFSLLIANATLEDIGDYCCKVNDLSGSPPRLVASAMASVRSPDLLPPRCYILPDPRIEAGKMASFVCKFQPHGPLGLSLQWQRDGADLETGSTGVADSGATLYYNVSFVREETGTVLRCRYREIPALVCQLPPVNVLYRPTAELAVVRGAIFVGDAVEVKISFDGNPAAIDLHWSVRPLQRYSFRDNGHRIEIHDIFPEGGFVNVSCRVVNNVGATVVFLLIRVKSPGEEQTTDGSRREDRSTTPTRKEADDDEDRGRRVNSDNHRGSSSRNALAAVVGCGLGALIVAVLVTTVFICVLACNKKKQRAACTSGGDLRVTYNTHGVTTAQSGVHGDAPGPPVQQSQGNSILLQPSNLAEANDYTYSSQVYPNGAHRATASPQYQKPGYFSYPDTLDEEAIVDSPDYDTVPFSNQTVD